MKRTRIYRKRTTSTAISVEEEYYPVWEGPKGRGRKLRPTSDAQQILNDKKSLKHFTDLVNNNFRQYEDLKIELTYCDARKPDGIDDARRLHAAFVRRLRRWYERRGKELKYVVVDEIGKNGTMRPHHHMLITGGIDYRTLKTLWGNGSVNVAPIDYEQYGSASWCEYVFKDPRNATARTTAGSPQSSSDRSNPESPSHRRARDIRLSASRSNEIRTTRTYTCVYGG